MEALLFKKINENNYHPLQVVLQGKGRDVVMEAIQAKKFVESYLLYPDYYVWVEEEPNLDEATAELSLENGISVTVWNNFLITKGDGDTNPASLTFEDFKMLNKYLQIDGKPLFH